MLNDTPECGPAWAPVVGPCVRAVCQARVLGPCVRSVCQSPVSGPCVLYITCYCQALWHKHSVALVFGINLLLSLNNNNIYQQYKDTCNNGSGRTPSYVYGVHSGMSMSSQESVWSHADALVLIHVQQCSAPINRHESRSPPPPRI